MIGSTQRAYPIGGAVATHKANALRATLGGMAEMTQIKPPSMRKVVAANLKELMAAHPALRTQRLLREATGLGGGSVDGACHGTRNTTIDTIEVIARAFRLEPWQLLVPGLDPGNLPGLRSRNNEVALYRELERTLQTAVHESIADYAKKSHDP